jgi:hypothetical protein
MRRQFNRTGMMNFIPREFADLIRRKFDERDCIAVVSGEFNHESTAIVEDMDHCSHIIHSQAVFRQVDIQGNAIEFSDHQVKDTR